MGRCYEENRLRFIIYTYFERTPSMLDTFVGNESLKETVATAVKSGRFPHAFIIEGEPGSGRHTFAKILAAAAVCEDENAPCGSCRSCKLVATDGHCDVLTYAPDGSIIGGFDAIIPTMLDGLPERSRITFLKAKFLLFQL